MRGAEDFVAGNQNYVIAGHRSSMAFMISSAQRTASAIAPIVAGTLFPPSNCANLRAARIDTRRNQQHAFAAFVHATSLHFVRHTRSGLGETSPVVYTCRVSVLQGLRRTKAVLGGS